MSGRASFQLLNAPVLPWSYSQPGSCCTEKCGRTGISPGRRCLSILSRQAVGAAKDANGSTSCLLSSESRSFQPDAHSQPPPCCCGPHHSLLHSRNLPKQGYSGAFNRSRNSEQSPTPVREHGSIQPAFRLRTSGSNSLHHTVSADVKLAVGWHFQK